MKAVVLQCVKVWIALLLSCLGFVVIPNLENSQPLFFRYCLYPSSVLSLLGSLLRSMFDLLTPLHPPVSQAFIYGNPRRLGYVPPERKFAFASAIC